MRARETESHLMHCVSHCVHIAPAWGAFSFFFLPLVVVADAAGYLTTLYLTTLYLRGLYARQSNNGRKRGGVEGRCDISGTLERGGAPRAAELPLLPPPPPGMSNCGVVWVLPV